MLENKEELKNKIIYRASYRGSKEMDILMTKFVKSIINNLNLTELNELNHLVNLDDESLINIRNNILNDKVSQTNLIKSFQKFLAAFWCLFSVVLTKSVLEIFNLFEKFIKFSETLSTKTFGSLLTFFAAFSTFCPCSSVPVVKRTSYSSKL